MEIQIRPVRPEEYHAVEVLVRDAFWNVYRPGAIEHYVIHLLREAEGYVPELDLVLEMDGVLIGQSLYMQAEIALDGGGVLPVLCLGPIGIAPAWQRRGLGKRLLDEGLARAAALSYRAVCLEGNAAFYGQSGFVHGADLGLRYRDDADGTMAPYFLVRELQPGYLSGVCGVYAPPAVYFVDEVAAERYDAQFPPKEKKRLPGQLV